jgi:hypothetical protein
MRTGALILAASAALSGALASAGCDRGSNSAQGCVKDTDCKGDRVCQGGQCVESTPLAAPSAAPVASGTSAASGDAESTATPDQRRQWWVSGPLIGNDNSMAAMKGARISGAGPYSLHVDNQSGFTCTVEFNDEGRPSRVSACSAPDGWHFRNQSFGLRCAVNKQTRYEVCSGSTGGIASNIAPNSYDFDGFSIARKLAALSPVGGTVPVSPGAAGAGSGCNPPCRPGERCVGRRAYGTTWVAMCESATPKPDQCSRSSACPGGLKCCHEFHNACAAGICEGDPLVCSDTCAD